MRRRHENDKHRTSCHYAHFLNRKTKQKKQQRMKKLPKLTRKEDECLAPRVNIQMENIWINSRWSQTLYVLHIPLFVSRTPLSALLPHTFNECPKINEEKKWKHNRKWLIIVCLFFSLFALSLIFLLLSCAFFWALHQKVLMLGNHFSINFVGANMRLYAFQTSWNLAFPLSLTLSCIFIPLHSIHLIMLYVRDLRSIWTI